MGLALVFHLLAHVMPSLPLSGGIICGCSSALSPGVSCFVPNCELFCYLTPFLSWKFHLFLLVFCFLLERKHSLQYPFNLRCLKLNFRSSQIIALFSLTFNTVWDTWAWPWGRPWFSLPLLLSRRRKPGVLGPPFDGFCTHGHEPAEQPVTSPPPWACLPRGSGENGSQAPPP